MLVLDLNTLIDDIDSDLQTYRIVSAAAQSLLLAAIEKKKRLISAVFRADNLFGTPELLKHVFESEEEYDDFVQLFNADLDEPLNGFSAERRDEIVKALDGYTSKVVEAIKKVDWAAYPKPAADSDSDIPRYS